MKKALQTFLITVAIACYGAADGQSLSKISPVTLKKGSLSDSLSFVLTTLDNNLYKHKPLLYASGIQIIDADAPWPPRWYALHSSDTSAQNKPTMMLMLNAVYDSGHLRFLTLATDHNNTANVAVLACDKQMQTKDTFFAYHKLIDSHDFLPAADGGMIYFAVHDTVVDIRQAYHDPTEFAVDMLYQTIEIADSKGKSVFSWSPLSALGLDAIYLPYRYTPGVRSGHSSFDWSHGNSLHYDYDGNILYSFRHIGIGKVSRADGHVIWHIDRNKQRINAQSDSLPIFLQHDMQAVRDPRGQISYTVWSNGDSAHPYCQGFQFTVNINDKAEPIVKVLKTISPSENIPGTGGGGNMDVDIYGDYLLNYGLFTQDSTLSERSLFEYKDVRSGKLGLYQTSPTIFSFRVHTMDGWRPARPVISLMGTQLYTDIKSNTLQWYRLSGAGLKTVKYLKESETFTPTENGFYCVASRLGIGWSVSRPFKYTKK